MGERVNCLEKMFSHITELTGSYLSVQLESEQQVQIFSVHKPLTSSLQNPQSLLHDPQASSGHDPRPSCSLDLQAFTCKLYTSPADQIKKPCKNATEQYSVLGDNCDHKSQTHTGLSEKKENVRGKLEPSSVEPSSETVGSMPKYCSQQTLREVAEEESCSQTVKDYEDGLDGVYDSKFGILTPKPESSHALYEYEDCLDQKNEEAYGVEYGYLQLCFEPRELQEVQEDTSDASNSCHDVQEADSSGTEFWWDSLETKELWAGDQAGDKGDNLASSEEYIDCMYYRLFGTSTPIVEAASTGECEEWLDQMFDETVHGFESYNNAMTQEATSVREHATPCHQECRMELEMVSSSEGSVSSNELKCPVIDSENMQEPAIVSGSEGSVSDNKLGCPILDQESMQEPAIVSGSEESVSNNKRRCPISDYSRDPSKSMAGDKDSTKESASDTTTTWEDITIRQLHSSSMLRVPVVVQGEKINAVVDTAAEVTVISDTVFREMEPKPPCLKKVILHMAACDMKMTGLIVGPVTLRLGNTDFPEVVYVAPIHDDMLLGLDFLLKQKVNIKLKELCLHVIAADENVPFEIVNSQRNGNSVSRVTTGREEHIPACPTAMMKSSNSHERANSTLQPGRVNTYHKWFLCGLETVQDRMICDGHQAKVIPLCWVPPTLLRNLREVPETAQLHLDNSTSNVSYGQDATDP
ncbi:MAG: retropepsin-like aspartic protease, partial [Candidatus Thiodiazotropha sp.]